MGSIIWAPWIEIISTSLFWHINWHNFHPSLGIVSVIICLDYNSVDDGDRRMARASGRRLPHECFSWLVIGERRLWWPVDWQLSKDIGEAKECRRLWAMDCWMGRVGPWILKPVKFLNSQPLFFKLNGLRNFSISKLTTFANSKFTMNKRIKKNKCWCEKNPINLILE